MFGHVINNILFGQRPRHSTLVQRADDVSLFIIRSLGLITLRSAAGDVNDVGVEKEAVGNVPVDVMLSRGLNLNQAPAPNQQ